MFASNIVEVANRPGVARHERTRPQGRELVKFDAKEQGGRRRADPCALIAGLADA